MSMVLNSPVKMLPQEVKTPLAPGSEMSSTIGSAEYKRKPGPDASAAPYAKKREISDATTGLPTEDKTPPLEVSSECSENDKVLEEPKPDREIDMSNLKMELLDECFVTGPRVDTILYYTTDLGDHQALRKALADKYAPDSELYKKRYKMLAFEQRFNEIECREQLEPTGLSAHEVKMHVQAVFYKTGRVVTGAAYFPKKF